MGWDEGGSLSPVETFLVCPSSVGSSSQVSVRGRGCFPCEMGGATCTRTAKLVLLQPPILKLSHSRPSEAETGRFRGCVLSSVGLLSSIRSHQRRLCLPHTADLGRRRTGEQR